MTSVATPSFVSNPLYHNEYMRDAQKNRLMRAEASNAEMILASKNGAPSYMETVNIAGYVDTELQIKSLPIYQTISESFVCYFNGMESQLQDALEVAKTIKTTLMQLPSLGQDGTGYNTLIDTLQSSLGRLTLILNRTPALSGVAQQNPVVKDLTDLPPIEPTEPLDYSYYLGAERNMDITILETNINKFPITGEDDFFAKLIQSCRIALSYRPSESDTSVLNAAQNMCDEAVDTDYLSAMQSVQLQRSYAAQLVDIIPKNMIDEKQRQAELNNQDKLLALLNKQQLDASIKISEQLSTQNIVMSRNYIDALARI